MPVTTTAWWGWGGMTLLHPLTLGSAMRLALVPEMLGGMTQGKAWKSTMHFHLLFYASDISMKKDMLKLAL